MGFQDPGKNVELAGMTGEMRPVEVHSIRPSRRTGPNGNTLAMLVVELTQTFRADPDGARYRGGCTVLVNLNTNEPCYIVRKRLGASSGAAAQRKARLEAAMRAAEQGVRYFTPGFPRASQEAFRLLHRHKPQE